jgi:hypothetical protein
MRLKPGCRPYENPEHPVMVRHKLTGNIGRVSRVTPSGNHIPPQAYILFGNENGHNELWVPLNELERVG